MKPLKCIAVIIFFAACTDGQTAAGNASEITSADTVIKHDTVYYTNDTDWQEGSGLQHDPDVDSIWGKPVKFYINNPKCSPIAIDFYFGEFKPGDNRTTVALLALVTTSDSQLRPFYRWCLNKTILIQDGALGEHTGVPARKYAEKYPKEFFEYMDIDTSKEKYNDWVNSISYSGFYDQDEYKKTAAIRKQMIDSMKQNCRNCSGQLLQRIEKFANDCLP